MLIGFVGSGNMARSLALGWGEPALFTDAGSGRAAELASQVGGEAVESNKALASRADIVVLAHKPAQLTQSSREIDGEAKIVVSLLARTPLSELRHAYPEAQVVRVQPNLAVETGRGVTVVAEADHPEDTDAVEKVSRLFERVGTVVTLPEKVLDAAAGVSAVAIAYWALIAEAQIDSAVRHGVSPEQASILVCEAMAGAAEILRSRGYDTLQVRREVASPGGTTARGLAALERGGVRAAFADAIDEVLTQ
jgi:pyrroline-5-carboxylate reductase